jgi:hypothetical protein
MSFRPSVWNNSAPTGRIFAKFYIVGRRGGSVTKICRGNSRLRMLQIFINLRRSYGYHSHQRCHYHVHLAYRNYANAPTVTVTTMVIEVWESSSVAMVTRKRQKCFALWTFRVFLFLLLFYLPVFLSQTKTQWSTRVPKFTKYFKQLEVNNFDLLLISNFRCVLNVVFFLLGDSPASEFYMPTFWNTLFHFHRRL